MIEALQAEWVRTLLSRGLSMRRIVFRHVLRNAAGPALSILALQFIGLLGGAVVIEQISRSPDSARCPYKPPPVAIFLWCSDWSAQSP